MELDFASFSQGIRDTFGLRDFGSWPQINPWYSYNLHLCVYEQSWTHISAIFIGQLRPSGCGGHGIMTCGVIYCSFFHCLERGFDHFGADGAKIRLSLGWE